MKWQRLGLVFGPSGESSWAKSHATVPTPVLLRDGEIRVYVGMLDERGVGRVGYVDVAAENPRHILRISEQPCLDIGERGCFDDNGVLPSCFVQHDGRLYMYYNGFQLGVKIRYTIFSGLAVSDDGGETFQRVSRAAVLDRSDKERTFRAAPFVCKENECWRIWYPAGSSWVEIEGKEVPVVKIVYAESNDGIHWPEQGRLVIDFRDDDEHGVGRPWILRENGLYKMFYSIRVKSRPGYSGLGYAESPDGISWIRKDEELGLELGAAESFDSHMLRYGVPVKIGQQTLLFYNGNDFGRSGFGYAVLAGR